MAAVIDRAAYLGRVFAAYLGGGTSQLSFWHETPAIEPAAFNEDLGPYYMTFAGKARYAGPFDAGGIPLLDYRGRIGRRYNPIAIAQYGLARYNEWLATGKPEARTAFLRQASWLASNLLRNRHGVPVWMHQFDWEYREPLRAPWYSGLAQGQGISLLLRAHKVTGEERLLRAARSAFKPLELETASGGVLFKDAKGRVWIEEYIVTPPSHILNGFLWALWGVHDYARATGEPAAQRLFSQSVRTLLSALTEYDTGYWSRYELSKTMLPMIASPFYHRLHIVQLRITAKLTGEALFAETADRWEGYQRRAAYKTLAVAQKSAFKLLYY